MTALEHLGEPGSAPRNSKIAAVLHETRFAETKGSGIRVMREMAEAAGLAPPLFESDRGRDLFVARFFFHHFLGEDDLRWLAGFKALNLSEGEARALVVAREAGAMDNATYRDLNKVDTLAASTALRRLRDAGLFEQNGRGSATWYKPSARMLAGTTDVQVGPNPKTIKLDLETTRLDAKTTRLDAKTTRLRPKTTRPDALSTMPPGERRQSLLAALPPGLRDELAVLGRHRPQTELRALVLAVCSVRPWQADDLALLFGRRIQTMRHDYLRPLLRTRRLVMTRPDKPSDPQQAYRAVEADE